MTSCSICGKKDASVISIIEGVQLDVCEKCSKLGKTISRPKPKISVIVESTREIEETVVKDYASKIRNLREKSKQTQEDFALSLNEKLSVIKSIEQNRLVPPLSLAKKLENKFGIILIEEQKESGVNTTVGKTEEITLGDMIMIKKRKK